MRTVDPSLWSKKTKRRKMQLARPMRFGRQWGFEARVRGSFRDAMDEFWQNCSVEGVRRINSEHTRPCERYRWMLLLTISLVAGTLTLLFNLMCLVTEPPLIINLQNAQHSIKDLPFPAVALCSFNIVSRRRLDAISALIASVDQNRTYTYSAIRRNLLDSGALLTLALPKVDLQFAHYLSQISNKNPNITDLMFQLSPGCEDVLLKCSWAGKEKPCERIFAKRITSLGVCCVFNGRYEDFDRHNPPKTLSNVGPGNGLSVVVREDTEDFAYVRKPSIGIEVLVFDGTEFPLLEGGSVNTLLAPPETSSFYTISVSAQVISPEIVYYNEAWVC